VRPHLFRLDAAARILFLNQGVFKARALSYKQMIGNEIGNYRILEKLGDGGMGVVYKAIDTQLDRVVAIKALSPDLSGNPALVERFRTEARAHAQLNHPNLATLYAFLVQDGVAYMVMEFVDGETFHGLIARRGPIPAEEAVPLFRQALAGIGHAHRMGIVHRDVKPSNIMLNRDGVVKVMDFGLAKVAGNHGMTRTGVRLGTAYYMSPEQVLVKPVDVRSDIYSLGVTLYEMLTGQAPFQADSEFEILNDHVNTPPAPPSRLYPQIPQGIENAVLKALAKDPDQRFQTVDQFAAALEHPAEFYAANTMADAPPVAPDRRITVATAQTLPAPADPSKAAFWTGQRKLLAGVGVALAGLLAAWLILRPVPPQVVMQVSPPPASVTTVPPAVAQPQSAGTATAPPAPLPPPETPAPRPEKIEVPDATHIFVRPVGTIDSKADLGQVVAAHLAAPVTLDGREVFHVQDAVQAQVAEAVAEGSSKEERILELISITSDGHIYRVKGSAPLPKKASLRAKAARLIAGKDNVEQETPIQFTLSRQEIALRP
jgi:hypothetical protein